jgi:predicted acylesterase/phospholipase RssA/CRP-like cAMP-binding protein
MDQEQLESSVMKRIGDGFGAAELSALLAGAPFLDGLAPAVVAELAAACERVHVEADAQLLRSEVPNDSLWIVVHGGLRTVSSDALGGERVVSEAYRGDGVGLIGLLPRVSTPIDVFAIRDSVLLRLRRARFEAVAARHPELVVRLAEGIARRGVELIGQQREWTTWSRPGSIAQNVALLLPAGDRYFSQAVSALARAALERYRRVAHVTREWVDAELGERASAIAASDAGNERVLAFLQSLEPRSEIVLYECEAEPHPWSARCLGQADRVLAIVRADRPEHLASLRATLERVLQREQAPHLDLALVQPEHAEVPRDTSAWGWLRNHARIHQVRTGERRDYERVARTLLRSGVAVVLSGGGARGIAHVGVLKALEEAGVPVDAIGGTSMGALIAAGYARGWSADALMVRLRDLLRRSRALLYDPTLPFVSLLAGRKLERVMRDQFEGLDIEDLWLPFFCVSTDLARAAPTVHDRGELWKAVAASCSIPGIFPPRRAGGRLLVDGGVIDNLPIDVMAARFDGAIIASDVNLYGEVSGRNRPRTTAAQVREFVRWLNPFDGRGAQGPEIFEILIRSSLVGSQRAALTSLARGEASLHLELPVERFRLLDWSAHEELFEVGYRFASERLATWQPPASLADSSLGQSR